MGYRSASGLNTSEFSVIVGRAFAENSRSTSSQRDAVVDLLFSAKAFHTTLMLGFKGLKEEKENSQTYASVPVITLPRANVGTRA